MSKSNAKILQDGIKDAIPIGLGYFAVAFSQRQQKNWDILRVPSVRQFGLWNRRQKRCSLTGKRMELD